MKTRLSVVLCLTLLSWTGVAASQPAEQAPQIEARLDGRGVYLGRPFAFCITAWHEHGAELRWPEPLALGDVVEERARTLRSGRDADRGTYTELCLELQIFELGVRSLPALEVSYSLVNGRQGTAMSRPVPITVIGAMGAQKLSLRGPADPVAVMVPDWRLLGGVGGAVAIVCVVLGMFWIRRLRRAREVIVVSGTLSQSHRSPYQEALARLDALESSGALDADDLKPCFLAMSEIVRNYVGRRYGFSAMDLTSSETESRLRSMIGAEDWLDALSSWLSRSDLVKYAKSEAEPEEAREALYNARSLVETTRASGEERGGVGDA